MPPGADAYITKPAAMRILSTRSKSSCFKGSPEITTLQRALTDLVPDSKLRLAAPTNDPRTKFGTSMGESKKRVLCVEADKDFCELLTLALPQLQTRKRINQAASSRTGPTARFCSYTYDYFCPTAPAKRCVTNTLFDKITPILFITTSNTHRNHADLSAPRPAQKNIRHSSKNSKAAPPNLPRKNFVV